MEASAEDAVEEEEEALANASQMRDAILKKKEVCPLLGQDLTLLGRAALAEKTAWREGLSVSACRARNNY